MTRNLFRFLLTRHDGNDPTTPPPPPPAPPAPQPPKPADPAAPPKPEDPLGEPGLKALQAERERAAAAEKRANELEAQVKTLEPLKPLAELLGGKSTGETKTDLEKLTARVETYETELAKERLARTRIEVAAEKGLTPAQAARLVGNSREELATDADNLKTLFPAAPATPPGPTGPAPDPSQGRGGNSGGTDFRTADKSAFDAELAKYGLRPQST